MRNILLIAVFLFPISAMAEAPLTEADKLKQAAEHGIYPQTYLRSSEDEEAWRKQRVAQQAWSDAHWAKVTDQKTLREHSANMLNAQRIAQKLHLCQAITAEESAILNIYWGDYTSDKAPGTDPYSECPNGYH